MKDIFIALTEAQNDRLIEILWEIVKFIIGALGILLPSLLLYFQRINKETVTQKIDEVEKKLDLNTKVSEVAFNVANGHNAKIVELREDLNRSIEAKS